MTNLTQLIQDTISEPMARQRTEESPLARLECERDCPKTCDAQAQLIKEMRNAPPNDD